MTDETDIRDFDFESCPFCGAEYHDSDVLQVQSDEAGPLHIFIECGQCGAIYRVDRVTCWWAQAIEKGEVDVTE